ncbi:hypothetical protein [Sphingomonas montanisoli]|uniref:Uncharacterized protein n=1 Tax=Sphingomonas montanisoli TaxID=2606412 RepID=A0A5D9CB03_9SPHN|nr:hypothetical protein [Sphingomonas montanisoli]TZG27235.1 hypothetical protein FYJ91_06325 [Sphingomonas montanisoli]
MKKRRNPPRRAKAHKHPPAAAKATRPGFRSFTPVALRARSDGFTPERQQGFIEALAECGCVEEACQRVGISATAAYALRRRIDAVSFRQAWEAALDYAVRRLSDAVFSRAIKGVSRPIFYKGEQVGERIHYDERLAQFILRYRDPTRYGRFIDKLTAQRPPDAAAVMLNIATDRAMEAAYAMADGESPEDLTPLNGIEPSFPTEEEVQAQIAEQWRRDAEASNSSFAESQRAFAELQAARAKADAELWDEDDVSPDEHRDDAEPASQPLYEPWAPPPPVPSECYTPASSRPRVRLLGGDSP